MEETEHPDELIEAEGDTHERLNFATGKWEVVERDPEDDGYFELEGENWKVW